MHIIQILRDYLGITQQALAREAGITQADLCEMETRPPYGTIEKYKRLSAVLGVPVHALVTNDCRLVSQTFFDSHTPAPYTGCSNHIRSRIGRAGEEAVLQMERERLQKISPALAQLVIPYFKLRAASVGYDILSFDDDGVPVFIEVKTTCQDASTEFNLTRNEYDKAEKLTKRGNQYLIYRLSGWGTSSQRLDVMSFQEMMHGRQIIPSEYICSMKPRRTELSGIAYYRCLRNLTQVELARQLEILPNDLCLYERGERKCPVTVYQKLSQMLAVSIDALLETHPLSDLN